MHDLVLRGGTVLDGSGTPRFKGDVGVEGDKIAAVSREPGSLRGRQVLDVRGLCVSPGFIDIHSHADRSILANSFCRSSLLQGITTLIGGNCGGSIAPLNEPMKQRLMERAKAMGIEMHHSADWHSVGDFLSKVRQNGTGTNFGMFVGQGTVRNYVMGYEERAAAEDEIKAMRGLVREAMEQGAFGLSAGRSYLPGRFAAWEEISELCKQIEPYGGLYACHMKSEGDHVIEAFDELMNVARSSGCRPHIAHFKVVGKHNWGKAKTLLACIETAREEGFDLLYDVYPYPFAQVSTLRGMLSGITPVLDIGDFLSALRRDPAYAQEIAQKAEALLMQDPVRFQNLPQRGVVWCQHTKEHEGKSIEEIAQDLGIGLIPSVIWLAVENQLGVKVAFLMDEAEVEEIMQHPFSMIATDAATTDNAQDRSGATHPRAFSSYPRVLGRYVRERGTLSLEDAIRKMTHMPAERLGISDRGLLKPGHYADIVVFDKNTVGENANLDTPCLTPSGIEYVFVNGKMAVVDGNLAGLKAGKVLCR